MSWQQPGCSVASMARKNPTCAPSQESSSNKKDVILKNVSCQMVKVASSSKGAHTIWPVTSPTHVDEGLLGRGLLCDLLRRALTSTFLNIVHCDPLVSTELPKAGLK